MTDVRPEAPTVVAADRAELLARLQAHRRLGNAPRAELEWLVAHGTLERYAEGLLVARKGRNVDGLFIILSGRISHLTDQGGSWRKVIEWRAGDVTGQLPYSRMAGAPGNSVVEEPTEALRIPSADLQSLPVECPNVTAELVHVMVDRARTFQSSDLQVEKMASLGKVAAGLAHELNNPASAAARSAQSLADSLAECDLASRALGAAGFDAREMALIERLRSTCAMPATSVRTPLEQSDREEAIADWLAKRGADEALAPALADTELALGSLDDVAAAVTSEKLRTALRWVAAGCNVRGLVRDIERASSRVHALVSAVKGFTRMDQPSAMPEPVDVGRGLTDTLAIIGAKARKKSASLTVDVPADLPRVRGLGGQLNQVWMNLVENALDAVSDGGNVTVTARADVSGANVVVRVTDDGQGVPPELRGRIFEPFFTTKPVGEGTGLGLDIVRRVVDSHSGLLEMESQPGHTEFRVTLPVAR
jgi:signal transduction histidine kinase